MYGEDFTTTLTRNVLEAIETAFNEDAIYTVNEGLRSLRMHLAEFSSDQVPVSEVLDCSTALPLITELTLDLRTQQEARRVLTFVLDKDPESASLIQQAYQQHLQDPFTPQIDLPAIHKEMRYSEQFSQGNCEDSSPAATPG